jgi:hypothetical protein
VTVIRAALIILVAFSVALVPIAGAKAHALLPEKSAVTVHSDCCPQGQHCDKQEKGDCAKLADCALKCSSLSAATVEAQTIALSRKSIGAGLFHFLLCPDPFCIASKPAAAFWTSGGKSDISCT